MAIYPVSRFIEETLAELRLPLEPSDEPDDDDDQVSWAPDDGDDDAPCAPNAPRSTFEMDTMAAPIDFRSEWGW
jgi:hypothetical protein